MLGTPAFNAKFNQNFNQRFASKLAAKRGGGGGGRGPRGGGGTRGPRVSAPAAAPSTNGSAAFLNPSRSLSGPGLLSAAQALAQSQEGPTISALQGQISQNDTQTQNALGLVGGFYNQLGQQAQSGVNQEGQIGSGLNSQLSGIASDEQNALRGIGQGQTASLMKYAPQSDQGNSLATPALAALTQEVARQQGLAAQNEGAFRAAGATQGANYQGLAASQLGTSALAGQEALKGIAQSGIVKNEPLTNRLASAISQRGAITNADAVKLRQQEISDRIANAGLGIKQQQANASLIGANARVTSANASAQNARTSAGRLNLSAKNQAFQDNPSAVGSPAWDRVQKASGTAWSSNPNAVGSPAWGRVQLAGSRGRSGGVKPLTTASNNQWFSKLRSVQSLIKDGQHHGQSEQQIRSALTSGQTVGHTKYDPLMVQAAYEILGWGAVQQGTLKTLQAMGLRLPPGIRVAHLPKTIGGIGQTILNGFHV